MNPSVLCVENVFFHCMAEFSLQYLLMNRSSSSQRSQIYHVFLYGLRLRCLIQETIPNPEIMKIFLLFMFRSIIYPELSFVYSMRKKANIFLFHVNTQLSQQEFLKILLFPHYSLVHIYYKTSVYMCLSHLQALYLYLC